MVPSPYARSLSIAYVFQVKTYYAHIETCEGQKRMCFTEANIIF